MPSELKGKLEEDAALKAAFYSLTPGRQRGYIYHISGAKQSKTRGERRHRKMPASGSLAGRGFLD